MIYLVTNQKELFSNDVYQIISVEKSLELLHPLYKVGLDTETEGLDPYTKKLKTLQLGCRKFQIVIDCMTVDINNYKEYLESERLFIGWNLKFDLKFLYHQRIVPRKVYDGFLAEKLMYLGYPPGYHSFSLKTAGLTYCDVELDKSVRGKVIWAGLETDVIQYAARDVEYLEYIMDKQKIELGKRGLLTAIDYENRFVLPLSYMEYCGIKLDVDKWKAKMVKDRERERAAKEACDKWLINNLVNPSLREKYIFIDLQGDLFTGFNTDPQVRLNWNSPNQVAEVLKSFGVEVMVETKTKEGLAESVGAKVLKPQKNKCALIELYLEYREAMKLTSTYGDNFLKQINPVGRICTNYQQLGADTTRITSGGKDKGNGVEYVNLLNLPKDKETRACFVSEEGNKFISIDYTGQESVLMASIANDKAMIHELMYGEKDLHTLTAKIVFSEIPKDATAEDVKDKYPHLRQKAKGFEFAFNYMGNAATIKRNFGLADEQANSIYNSYMEGFSGLKAYQAFARKDWWDKGYILINPKTGHKTYIYDYKELKRIESKTKEPGFWDYYRDMKVSAPSCDTVQMIKNFFKRRSTCDRQSGNYRIQGTGSMCTRVSMVNMFEWLRQNNLLFKVLFCVAPYDEINVEAPAEIAEEIANKLYRCMVEAGNYFSENCKLDADISRDKNGALPNYWIH